MGLNLPFPQLVSKRRISEPSTLLQTKLMGLYILTLRIPYFPVGGSHPQLYYKDLIDPSLHMAHMSIRHPQH